MKRIALALLAIFLSSAVVLPSEASAATKRVKQRSYKKTKKVRRAKASKSKAKKRVAKRRSVIN
ncbi:MAG: hypothetical protein ABI823_01770 [Bryobacteraceae bacterium]